MQAGSLRSVFERCEFVHIRHRNDQHPEFAQILERNVISQTIFDVIGCKAVPPGIPNVSQAVKKNTAAIKLK
jgi:hypothetical protein